MRTLFLQAPSYEGFDGGAGSRYQARREIRSFWYPTWLAQAAALVPESTLIDAPPDDLTLADVIRRAAGHELIVIHTSTPSVAQDACTAAALKEALPGARIGFVGAHTMVLPEETLRAAPDRAIKPGARCARSGTRPGSPRRRRWCRRARSSMRRPTI